MRETFPMIPAPTVTLWFVGALGLLLVGLTALLLYFGYASRHVTFEVTPVALTVRGDLYGRRIARSALDLEGARLLDLTREPEYRLKWRTNGAGFPGYAAGWFRLGNGEKCLAFVTDPRRTVYLPTREGYSVLVSCADGARLLEALGR